MKAFEKYLEYENRINALEDEGASEEEIDKLEEEQISIRNNEFTKEDWDKLIEYSKCSKRAVYEYTRMMNEKFPTAQTSSGNQTQWTKMTKCEQYLEYQKQWSKAAMDGDDALDDEISKKGLALRETFLRDDWNELINQSSGRARFEYERMRNAKFPTDEQ